MKALILAAGSGKRFLPLTEHLPKPMIAVQHKGEQKPFLHFALQRVLKAGILQENIAIIVGYKKEKIEEFVKKHKLRVTLIEQSEPKGAGHAVYQAKNFIGNDEFLMLAGDNLYAVDDIKKMAAAQPGLCFVAGFAHEQAEQLGLLEYNPQTLSLIKNHEKLQGAELEAVKARIAKPLLINTFMMKLTPEIFKHLKDLPPNKRGEIDLNDALNILAKQGKVKVMPISTWIDFTCTEHIPKVEKYLAEHY